VTYLIEYLGEFEFKFETVLGYVSGDQMGSFEVKKTKSKISCLGTFKLPVGSLHHTIALGSVRTCGHTEDVQPFAKNFPDG
jgi:hypothetical protein